MSINNKAARVSILASYGFCGLAILGVIALVWALGRLDGRQAEQRHSQPHRHAIAAKEQAEADCTGRGGNDLFQCVYERIEKGEETARTEQDLTAQQRAAWAAMAAALFAFLSFPVGAVGLWALWRTFKQGEAALAQARNAVATENRAWMVDGGTGSGPGHNPYTHQIEKIVLTIDWVNSGNTPALSAKAGGEIITLPPKTDLSLVEFGKPHEGKTSRSIIGQGRPMRVTLPIDLSLYQAGLNNHRIIILHSWMSYKDVFSNEWRYSEATFRIIPALPVHLAQNIHNQRDLVYWEPVTRHHRAT